VSLLPAKAAHLKRRKTRDTQTREPLLYFIQLGRPNHRIDTFHSQALLSFFLIR
jgi:hypothetical protein